MRKFLIYFFNILTKLPFIFTEQCTPLSRSPKGGGGLEPESGRLKLRLKLGVGNLCLISTSNLGGIEATVCVAGVVRRREALQVSSHRGQHDAQEFAH